MLRIARSRLLAKCLPSNSLDLGLERPSADQLCAAWMDVEGWARARDGSALTVTLLADGVVIRQLQPDIARPDVAAVFKDPRHARFGFATRVMRSELPTTPRFALEIAVTAQTRIGRLRNRSRRVRLPIRLAPAGSTALIRGDFGEVWDATATTAESAQVAVCGTVDQGEFHRSGQATAENVATLTQCSPSDVVLEIGCGVGRVGLYLAPRCGRWIGTDVSTKMIDHARQNLAGLPNVAFQLLNGYELSNVASASVDVVYCTGVFMHLDEWDRFRYVAEAHRVLRSGGRIYFNNVDALTAEGWKMFTEVSEFEPAIRPANASKTSTPQELENYAHRAGFTNIGVHLGPLLVTVTAVRP